MHMYTNMHIYTHKHKNTYIHKHNTWKQIWKDTLCLRMLSWGSKVDLEQSLVRSCCSLTLGQNMLFPSEPHAWD